MALVVPPTSVASLRQALRAGYDAHGIAYGDRWLLVTGFAFSSHWES